MNESNLDSQRFSLSIHREVTEEIDTRSISSYILNNNVDILILRVDSKSKDQHHKLSSLGIPYIHCDNLVYYQCDLEKYEINKLRNDINFKVANEDDLQKIESLVSDIFVNYKNHYFSNPKLNNTCIVEGYKEWVKNYVLYSKGKITWLVLKGEEVVGFATCSFDDKEKICEGILYGILPEKSGGGIYSDLIRFTQNYFKNIGYQKMQVSTQIVNYAVQKVWSREGFYMFKSFDTYHINSFLSDNDIEYEEVIEISKEEIEEFGEFSGDFNPIHFDDDRARQLGFKSRIVHGVKFELLLTRILGEKWPGNGTTILSNKVLYKKPIYPSIKYNVKIKCVFDNKRGVKELVTKMSDKDNNIACIAYTNIIKK